ncbi:MAG: helix-turn-helix transcriptional regulator [Bifidobacteriaceae bacterium]|jgi:transcriptional regulator with XRE-family HTH domain|nr:helix-turn-helix transcriptional regulator [Bifidobacteriaceae bacterium]
MDSETTIRGFLRARRAAVSPEQAGFGDRSARRRVKGLRREEVALLANISVEYYTLLERGRLPSASDSVVEALADALQLDAVHRDYLWTLARGPIPAHQTASALRLWTAVLRQVTARPALIIDYRQDVLAMNQVSAVLFGPIMPTPPETFNFARQMCQAAASGFFDDWPDGVVRVASMLRADSARFPEDPACLELVEELRDASPEFRDAWDRFEVGYRLPRTLTYHHRDVGRLTVEVASTAITQMKGAYLIVYLPATREDEAPIARLAALAAGGAAPAAPQAGAL